MLLLQDIRHALRLFRRTPSLTAIALLSIALSVAATAVVFAAVKSVLIDPLPYANPGELVQIRTEFPNFAPSRTDWAFWSDAQEIAHRTRTLESVATYQNAVFDLAGGGATPPEALYGLRVSANLFPTLGVTPFLGRNILPEEDKAGHIDVIILSYGLWLRRFNADRGVIGHSVSVDGHDCEVIGVMSPGFNFPLRRAAAHTPSPYVEFWAPLHVDPATGGHSVMGVLARLRRGVSLSEAQQDLAAIGADLSREFAATNRDHRLRLGSLRDRTLGSARAALWFLMAAALLFLLIGCANVANLLLARGLARQREIAIRLSLGAGTVRIVRQLLTESCVLALLGGVGGYMLTAAAWRILPAITPVSIPRLAAARADSSILWFSLGIALISGLLFGMAPALRASSVNIVAAHGLAAHGTTSARGNRLRGSLVAAEVAITLALVMVGGQLLGSFIELLKTGPGFEADHILASVILPSHERYPTPEEHGAVYARFLQAVRALPGVESAGTVDALPFSGENHGGAITVSRVGINEVGAEVDVVSAQYLQAMGVQLIAGRYFRDEDMLKGGDAAIVNDVVARRLWPGESAVDKPICVFCTPENPDNWKRVIGVVSSVRHATMEGPDQPSVYLSSTALERAEFLVVRTGRPPEELAKSIRSAIASVDPNQPVFLTLSMRTLIADSLADRRFIMVLLAMTACLALLMAVAGVYGVASYITSRRTQEIGVRMALGATPSNVEALMFRQGFLSAAVGIVIGLSVTFFLARILRAVLAGMETGDLRYAVMAIAVVSLTAAFACWLPARRAASIDPIEALRRE